MKRMIVLALTLLPMPAIAQEDLGGSEIIVTAQRREADGFDVNAPAIGLRRRADFVIQEVSITGDTRDATARHDEMYRMMRGAIDVAKSRGVMLATGNTVVEPLTAENYRNLTFKSDSRPDSERVGFLVKVPLGEGGDAKASLERIDAFVKAVAPVGRAMIVRSNDLTLSIVKPDQYRAPIVAAIAEDARAMAAKFGAGYMVEARGIERPVEWSRVGLTDVFLYVPYQLTIVPRQN